MKAKIEKLRRSLEDLVDQYGTLDPRVIERSELLDKLIVQYMKGLPEGPSKAASRITREERSERLETLARLRQGIEKLDRHGISSDPLVLEISRELDKLLIAYIRN